jgi:hypothetical protein
MDSFGPSEILHFFSVTIRPAQGSPKEEEKLEAESV